jgi:D-methionine transport system substrate-binding protein
LKQANYAPYDYLLFEDPDIFSCGLVVNPVNAEAPWAKAVVAVFQNKEFRQKFNDYWQGAYVLE